MLPFYSCTFPQCVPVTSRTVDFNVPCLLETTGEHSFQKGLNLSHNICLYFKLIKFLPAFFLFFFFFSLVTARGSVSVMTQVDVVLAKGSKVLGAEKYLLTFHHVSGFGMAQGTLSLAAKSSGQVLAVDRAFSIQASTQQGCD